MTLPLHSLTAEAVGGYLCCSRTSAMPSPPQKKASRTTFQRQQTWLQRASRQLQEGKQKMLGCCVWYASGCDMTGGADPAQPTKQSPNHHFPPEHYSCCAQCNNVTLGSRPPIQPSAVGDRSLMWPYHITGTPGCSTPKVDNQHSLG